LDFQTNVIKHCSQSSKLTYVNEHEHKSLHEIFTGLNKVLKIPRTRTRDREPSRICLKRVHRLMKNKKSTRAFMSYIHKNTPKSSYMIQLINHIYVLRNKIHQQENFIPISILEKTNVKRKSRKHSTKHQTYKSQKHTYCLSKKKLLMSGDVERNPGPFTMFQNSVCRTVNTCRRRLPIMLLLRERLAQYNLASLDVGGDGNCFFKTISHKLFGNSIYHLQIRSDGIQYLREHPERFIESNTENSWLEYLNNMSTQGTWADNIIIQAVADALNLKINIIETADNFTEITVIQPIESHVTLPTSIFIGHLDEMHYVSTVTMQSDHTSRETSTCNNNNTNVHTSKSSDPQNKHHNSEASSTADDKQKRKIYMREYMRKKRADNKFKQKEKELAHQRKIQDIDKTRTAEREACKKYSQNNRDKLKQIKKESFKKRNENNPQHIREINKQAFAKKKNYQPEYIREINKQAFTKKKESQPENIREINKQASTKKKERQPEHIREIKRKHFTKRKEDNPEDVRKINSEAVKRKRSAININKDLTNDFHSPTIKRKQLDNLDDQSVINESCTSLSDMPPTEITNDFVLKLIKDFHDKVKSGPEYICTCCDQLWYRSSVRKCNPAAYVTSCSPDLVNTCITNTKSIDNTEWICTTCHSNLKDGKRPACAKSNKMAFPTKPDVLDLAPLEERLVSPRIPFMQIRELPRGGQLTIHGNVVNVPADVNLTVNSLPRSLSDTQAIPIKLKRRLSYKHHYKFQNVRPKKVLEAAKYLAKTSELFKSEGITVNDNWIDSLKDNENEDWQEFIENPPHDTNNETVNSSQNNTNYDSDDQPHPQNENAQNITQSECTASNLVSDENDNWCEVEERPSGNMDTLLQEPDIAENGDNIISFAPGEGNKPLGIFMDKDSEFLSFPTIFCGKRREDNQDRMVPVHYSTVCKWELRNQDRRVANSVPNIFYKLKKIQIKQIQDSASLSLRKYKTKGKKYTAGDLKSQDMINNLVHLDEGFRVLRNLRGSPPYFEKCKKDLFAMIRQLGKPAWFCSFSAAETRWIHLLRILGRLVDKKDYTDNEIKEMTWQKKSDLIQRDPVTCARNFEHMVQLFIHHFMKSSLLPIGEIQDFFYRVEFQQRGSPHIHALFWIKDAPQYEINSNDEIAEFVDKYVTCHNDSSEEMPELMNLQIHRHAKTCKKKGHKVCRFNFPLPPMPRTMILQPLDQMCFEEEEFITIKQNSEKIKGLLDEMKYGENITFEELLQKLQIDEESYILAIQFSLTRDTLLLKRSPSEIRVNSYNANLLKAWRANMDIQYVLDPYACAVYILSYITKGQRGMSKLLEKACEEAKSGDKDIRNRVRHIGNKFLNAVEISAQEAVYLVLQMPLRRASRDFQFINTSNPEERIFLLKTMDKIKDLPDKSVDIESDNIIKRYQRRPRKLQNLCLADFVAWYNCVRQRNGSNQAS